MSPIFRTSYSMLAAWSSGDYQRAIDMYIGLQTEMSEAMQYGRDKHEEWEKEALDTGRLPKVFGGKQLDSNFEVEIKKDIMLTEWLQLVGVLDVREGVIGRDYKTGVTPAGSYLSSKQHKVYQILYPGLKRFEYLSYNQHLPEGHPDQTKMAMVHLTDKTLEDGIEFVLINAKAMWAYIQLNNIRKIPKAAPAEVADLEGLEIGLEEEMEFEVAA